MPQTRVLHRALSRRASGFSLLELLVVVGIAGLLLAVSASGGGKTAEYALDTVPVWDGMAAAYGRLYLSTVDGEVLCMAGR